MDVLGTLTHGGAPVQKQDGFLDQLAALTPAESDFLQFKDGELVNRTPAEAKADLGVASSEDVLKQIVAMSMII